MEESEVRLAKIEQTLELMGRAVDKLVQQSESLIRFEERQIDMHKSIDRAFAQITTQKEDYDAKLSSVGNRLTVAESDIGHLKEARLWMIGGIASFILLVCTMFGYWFIGK